MLIPWAARDGSLAGGWPLGLCWLAVVVWTFGFDTVYAMADRHDDARVGIRSSALSLGERAPAVVAMSYGIAALALGLASALQDVGTGFWLPWALAALGMQREAWLLRRPSLAAGTYGRHFQRQVLLGGLLLLGLVVGRS